MLLLENLLPREPKHIQRIESEFLWVMYDSFGKVLPTVLRFQQAYGKFC